MLDQKSARLIAKYAKRISMVESVQKKPMSFERKLALSHALENTSARIKAFEATNPGLLAT